MDALSGNYCDMGSVGLIRLQGIDFLQHLMI